jgi:peptidylprolyl isomerase
MRKNLILFLAAVFAISSCKEAHNDLPDGLYAEIETNK